MTQPEKNAHPTPRPPRLAIVGCAVLERETEYYCPDAGAIVGYYPMQQGLHNDPAELRRRVQATIDRIEAETDAEAIALVYGLCSRGTEGLRAHRCRLVIPRAHDCITLLLGSKERYAAYVAKHPGTYWYSPGWNAHHTPPGPERYARLRAEYAERFGEEDADFLMEMEQQWFHTYDRATYVHLTVGASETDKEYTQQCAEWLNWQYDEQAGDPGLLRDLVSGRWDEARFLVLEPGWTPRMTTDERIMRPVRPDEGETT